MKKAVIGLFVKKREKKEDEATERTYCASIEENGGVALVLPCDLENESIERIVNECDGFFFSGGMDIEPSRYGAAKRAECGETDKRRDEFELLAIERILKTAKPILGVCRGMQLINVALGGTLYQDIPSELETSIPHRQTEPKFSASHEVRVADGTPLYSLVNEKRMSANSFHHQCVKDLAKDLGAMAFADDGIIEAVYFKGERYIRAYQWHPERLYGNDPLNRRLFLDFIEACTLK